jgi:anti-sigma factor RsiW
VDFSLPVKDFKEEGFPLKGGRLDYVEERRLAALVYERGNHLINLFVWPAADDGDTPVAETSQRGYTLLHWTREGLNFWAVSDVNADDLQTFARLVRGEDKKN